MDGDNSNAAITNRAAGEELSSKSRVLETGAAITQVIVELYNKVLGGSLTRAGLPALEADLCSSERIPRIC